MIWCLEFRRVLFGSARPEVSQKTVRFGGAVSHEQRDWFRPVPGETNHAARGIRRRQTGQSLAIPQAAPRESPCWGSLPLLTCTVFSARSLLHCSHLSRSLDFSSTPSTDARRATTMSALAPPFQLVPEAKN